jgi:hypothetical protein
VVHWIEGDLEMFLASLARVNDANVALEAREIGERSVTAFRRGLEPDLVFWTLIARLFNPRGNDTTPIGTGTLCLFGSFCDASRQSFG